MSSHPGSVPLPRSIFHHPSLKRADRFQAYAWLLVEARWKTGSVTYRGRSIQLCRGEISITIRDFAKHLGWSSSTAWRFLADLEKKNLISLRKIKRLKGETAIETATDAAYETDFTVVTICNYGQFSESPLEDETATETDNDTAGETKKEEGGGKRIKKYKPPNPTSGVSGVDTDSSSGAAQQNSRFHATNPRSLGTNPRVNRSRIPYSQDFEAFWSAYPRSPRKTGKSDVFKKWQMLIKNGAAADQITRGTRNYAVHIKRKEKWDFVMGAARFLKEGHYEQWADEKPDEGRPSEFGSTLMAI